MAWINLNGKLSTDIQGLIICTLPPISKPLKRISTEEIDGKDGDTITELGYSAYDKEIEIGLSYNYNIDDVISYFDSEGLVTFSNEEDKYYRYKIIEQIDFEKLIRFKTAKVKVHIQPFKYNKYERMKTFNITQNVSEILIRNNGNTTSKPIITFYGTGTLNISLNGVQLLVINLDEDEEDYVSIDVEEMEAFKVATLRNRSITGDYSKFCFKVGKNKITWTGNLTKVEIIRFSRWI